MADGHPSWITPGKGGSSGGSHGGPSWISSAPAHSLKPSKKGGGGWLGKVTHAIGQGETDLYNTAVHAPSGLYQVGKAVVAAQRGNNKPLKNIASATAKGYKEDFQHPLRHPGNTLLDVASVASLGVGTAARTAAVGKALEEGGTVADGLRAARAPKPRILEHNGSKVRAGNYSRSTILRQTQKLFDQFHAAHPDVRPLPFGFRNFPERVGKELAATSRYHEMLDRAPAAELSKVGKKLSTPQQVALRVVAEGVPIHERIAFHEQQLPNLKGRTLKTTRRQIVLLKQAEQYVHDINGMPRFKPEHGHLVDVYEKARSVSQQREAALGNTTRVVRQNGETMRVPALSDTADARIHAPGNLIKVGEPYPSAEAKAEARFVHIHGLDPSLVPEVFHGGDFRVPYKADMPKAALFKPAGYRGGNERAPGSLTHSFSGALLKHGVFHNDTTRLVAESYLEAHRFAALVASRDQFLKHATSLPMSEHDIPIRLDALKDRPWPKIAQKFEDTSNLKPAEVQALGHAYDTLRDEMFPPKAEFVDDPHAHPDVAWIDERVLGGINKPNPMVGWSASAGSKRTLSTFDAINNASRLAILYLKPAYAVPNILGNAALTLVHQGFAAPRNLAKAARLNAKLGPELASKVDAAMGEGVTGALHTSEGPLQKVTNKGANFWQPLVDTPFRRAAFLHEARRAGYKTPDQLKQLFASHDEFAAVARDANAAMIDYGRLGPLEKNVIRRIVFFYPWVKGSTQYATRFVGEHPTQAAVAAQLGKQGAAQDKKDLGDLPSYADGLFKVGERGGNPLVANPNSAGILETPGQLLHSARELGSGHPGQAFQFGQNFTPVIQVLLALAARQGVHANQSAISGAEQKLVGGLPLVTLLQGLQHPPSESGGKRVYPRSREDALLHYLVGGLAPTPLNKGAAQKARYREDHPH